MQCISYNPLSLMLVSCSLSDFGLWSPEQKNVTKYSVPSRVNGCTWTTDGLLFALGLMNGTVSIRNKVSTTLEVRWGEVGAARGSRSGEECRVVEHAL